MNLSDFKTVEQLATSIRTLLSGLRNFKGIAAGSVAPTADDIRATQDIFAGDNITAGGDIYSVAWTDYSGISSISGWSSYSNKEIDYKKVGNLVFVTFHIVGTSNSTSASFSVPYTIPAGVHPTVAIQAQDAGTTQTSAGLLQSASPPTSTVNLYKRIDALPWTNSGTKGVIGQFWYEA